MSIKNKHSQRTYQRGMNAEYIAAIWLQVKGYKILERRYKTKFGEIDLIVSKGNMTAFVEVKARQTKSQALESLTPNMKRRIENAARYYISQHHNNDNHDYDYRFDLLAIQAFKLREALLGRFFIHHLDNAWEATA